MEQAVSFQCCKCTGIRYQCIFQSCHIGMFSLSQQAFHCNKQNSFIWRENSTSEEKYFQVTFSCNQLFYCWARLPKSCSLGHGVASQKMLVQASWIAIWLTQMICEVAEKVLFRYIKLKTLLVYQAYHSKYHRTGNLTEIYFLTTLEAGNLKLRCWQGWHTLCIIKEMCICGFSIFKHK